MPAYHNPVIETMDRSSLDALLDDRVRYTVRYVMNNTDGISH